MLLPLLPLLLAGLLVGCATLPDVAARELLARQLAAAADMRPITLVTGLPLPLQGFARLHGRRAALVVYIEGDGHAWVSRHQPSSDPTPINPAALRLAVLDQRANVVYLARPGQYLAAVPDLRVDRRYWLSARFAPEVIDTYVAAVRSLAASMEAMVIELVGFSGGGTVAALVAARLQNAGGVHDPEHATVGGVHDPEGPEQVTLRTVAGNLDTAAWTRLRKLTPLAESLNPADEAATLRNIAQIHLLGTRDRQVPRVVFDAYVARLGSGRCLRVIEVDAAHAGPWEDAWRQVLAEPPPATSLCGL